MATTPIVMPTHTGVVVVFTMALADFPLNHNCLDDAYIQLMFNSIATILYSPKYDTVGGGVNNFMGIIKDPTSYTAKHGVAFPRLTRPKVFDNTISTKEAVLLAFRKA